MSPKKVFFEIPISFKVMDRLLALAHASNPSFILIDPETGFRILGELLNIPIIGLSTKMPSKHGTRMGFNLGGVEPTETDESDRAVYETEALLALDVDPAQLPEGTEGDTWVIQVKDFENMEAFRPIANDLSECFNVNIIMTPAHKQDSDPDHEEPRPVDEKFPKGPAYCPIIIRRIIPAN